MFKKEELLYKDFGVFFCGGLLRVEKMKRFIDFMAAFGYHSLRWEVGMYMDVDGEEPVSYMNGKYTHEEIKELDDYAYGRGIELIPCVQCFKHSGYITKYEKYKNAFAGDGYLLVDEPCVYELLKKYFLTFKRLFRTRHVHIGMDETFGLGSNGYLAKYGYEEAGSIYIRHLNNVVKLVEECGLTCEMWGDMLKEMTRKFRAGSKDCTKNYLENFPQNVRVIEWFYGGNYDHDELDNIFGCFKGVGEIAYCDAICTWPEYQPHNQVGLNTYEMHTNTMAAHGISTYLVSVWNDYQSCSHFACLPALFACSVYIHGKKLDEKAKAYFKEVTGVAFDDFMLLDLVNEDDDWPQTFWKNIFEENIFKQAKVHDVTGLNAQFLACAERLKKVDGGEFSLIFDNVQKFAECMAIKAELGKQVFDAYKAKDYVLLKNCIQTMDNFIVKLDEFIDAFDRRYTDEYYTHDIFTCGNRLGGLRLNTLLCKRKLIEYIEGRIPTIEILDEQI